MARQLAYDYRTADLNARERSLCEFAVKLTLDPSGVMADDLEPLRQHGFSDEQITVATQVIGYFNYINRIADGLGVDREDWMDVPAEQWENERGNMHEPL